MANMLGTAYKLDAQSPQNSQYPPLISSAAGGVTGAYGLANTAINQQAGDYSNIMKGYQDLASSPGYQNTANLAMSGGYSPEDISSIRERGISPIRSIYASANRDVDRQKAIQGGYSPNYAAVKAKMAREMSDTISNQETNVNAGLAERIAQNKIQMAPQFAAQAEKPLQNQQSLYGTTPALSSLFGNQALQAAQLQNNINQAPQVNPAVSKSMSGVPIAYHGSAPAMSMNAPYDPYAPGGMFQNMKPVQTPQQFEAAKTGYAHV